MNLPISPIGPVGQTYPVTRIQPINKDRDPEPKERRKPAADDAEQIENDDPKTTIDEKV